MDKNPAIVAPSLLAADFLNIGEAVKMVNNSEADWLHLDVMDGRFVPNISFGMPIISAVKKISKKPLDVHLMIVEPEKYAEDFKEAGADHLIVHYETCPHLHRNLQQIHNLGMKAGVAINPHTSVELLNDILMETDIVLIMSVNPGFGGQKFIRRSLHKIEQLKEMIIRQGAETLIEVDGGISPDNAEAILKAGADVLVAGSTIFSAEDPPKMIERLKYSAG